MSKLDHSGFVLLYRKSFNSMVWKNPNLWRFWTWALMKASHKKRTVMVGYEKIEIKPGQFVTGAKVAEQETGLSPRKQRTCKLTLQKHGKVTVKTTNKYSIITIVNWDRYQHPKKQNNSQNDSQATSKRQTNDNRQQLNTGNNVNKHKEIKTQKCTIDFEATKKMIRARAVK